MSTKLGCWLGLPSVEVADIVGGAGYDFVVLDLEHGTASIETAARQMMALAGHGVDVLLRVPEPSEAWLKRALDAGAGGLIVPKVESAEAAADIVSKARYAPIGARGEALPVVRASHWGRRIDAYRAAAESLPIMCQIETQRGLEAAEDIAAVAGVTHLFFGPVDFSATTGVALDDPTVQAAAKRVTAAAAKTGKGAATIGFVGLSVSQVSAMGFSHVAVASDVAVLVTGLETQLKDARHG